MKEKLYTIPLNDAVDAGGECPLCNVEKLLEQDTMDFVLGSCASYMEPDVRELTDKKGFCREHMHKMFTYGYSSLNLLHMVSFSMYFLTSFHSTSAASSLLL